MRGVDEQSRLTAFAVVSGSESPGAGDALAAGYFVGGPEMAMLAAARCISQMGAQPELHPKSNPRRRV